MLAILDYGAGNQTSVARALQHMGIPVKITADEQDLQQAKGIIFPGVGAAGQAMGRLRRDGLDKTLRHWVGQNKPLFGVCLGCQILLDWCEENDTPSLGLVPGKCLRFPENLKDGDEAIRIPHMGWNTIQVKQSSCLLEGISPQAQFYFVHGYYTLPQPELQIANTTYGLEFSALYGRPGLWGAQFHPEKSGAPGLRLLQNFYKYCGEVC